MKRILGFLLLTLFAIITNAQDTSVSVNTTYKRINDKTVELTVTAVVKNKSAKLFALPNATDSLLVSNISFDTATQKFIKEPLKENGNIKTEVDASIGGNARFVVDSIQFIQNLEIGENETAKVGGVFNYLLKNGEDFPSAELPFEAQITANDGSSAAAGAIKEGENTTAKKSLWAIFGLSFVGGLLAVITPCVFSMIPVTVGFFTKKSKTKQEAYKNATIYAVSIIVIFTLIGFLVTLIAGPSALNKMSTNWIANLVFFALFVIFGVSFLGAFEINLPSSWTNKMDSKSGLGSVGGIFFMAFTLVLVSFSCTGPIIGNLLVLASQGSYMGPLLGMFGFSLALALPFALFAYFPNKLNMLGKSGGWLNSVKVTLGFLELALALKFFSNADLVKGWRLLDREIFIVLWVVIFLLLGLYLLGKLKFKHDSELPPNDFGLPHLTTTRLVFSIAAFSMVFYMIPGLFGAPLKGLSAFVPPMGTQDFNADDLPKGFDLNKLMTGNIAANGNGGEDLAPKKYVDIMHQYEPDVVVNNGLVTYFDYDEALAASRKLKKPLMMDFTGVNCVNCRKMEGEVWSDERVMKKLKDDFIIVSLFTDVHDIKLPKEEQFYSDAIQTQVTTLGDKYYDLQVKKFGTLTQPSYFFLDQNEKRLVDEGYGYDPNIPKFLAHLDTVLAEYKKRNP
ncbi:MAG: thioredoxin family protein [Chitinophagaceae bacterium]|nr:MAG: thioredoxin family protein [Chitinophagaceae bacterium]